MKNEANAAVRDDIITVRELADLLRLHPALRAHASNIYRLLRQGKLPAFKVGSGWAFSREAVGRMIERELSQ